MRERTRLGEPRQVSVQEGRKRVRRGIRRPLSEWDVLLKDQHEGYISWAEFERNQKVIADNATGKGNAVARGAARRGELFLAGLLRCGHCGRKMYVAYGGKAGRYHCEGALVNHGVERCISFGGLRADQAVGAEVLQVLKPLGVDAAIEGARRSGGRDVGREAAARAGVAAGAFRGRACAPAVRCCRSNQSSGGQ